MYTKALRSTPEPNNTHTSVGVDSGLPDLSELPSETQRKISVISFGLTKALAKGDAGFGHGMDLAFFLRDSVAETNKAAITTWVTQQVLALDGSEVPFRDLCSNLHDALLDELRNVGYTA